MRLRIRPTLIAATVALVVATTAGVGLAVGHLSGRIVEDLVDRRFRTIAEAAAADVSAQVEAATGVLREQRALVAQGLLPVDDAMALGHRFAERLRHEPQLAWISHGDRDRNSFVGATRLGDGSIIVNHSDGSVDGGRPREAVALPDGTWRAVESRRRDPYSVVAQPWFQNALSTDAIVVTGPYVFAEGRTGLTLSLRWAMADRQPRGVFTVDFFLDDLGHRLAALTGDRGDAVLLDPTGRLLASAGTVRPPALLDVAQSALRQHGTAVPAVGSSLTTDVAVPGDSFRAALTRMEVAPGIAWVLVVLEAEATQSAPLRQLHIAIAVVSAAVGLLGIAASALLAHHLTRPLDALSAEAGRIRRFDLEGSVAARSKIVELASLIEAVAAMKAGLRSFASFVPKDVVERLLAVGGAATLGGERRELTILFSDIVGFTGLSEQMSPEQVMRHTSRYFEAMSRAIHARAGVIDKFIGDGIMAFWNAPQRDPDHATHACRALLTCMQINDALDSDTEASGLPALPSRFGLHTAEVVVGNIGSPERMQYTALGAGVNLAARLEGLNKRYGTRNLVSAATRVLAGEGLLFRSVAIVIPVGTTRSVEVYELLGAVEDKSIAGLSEWVRRWEVAMAAIRRGNASEALALFEALAAERPADELAAFYTARSAELAHGPPHVSWDGVDKLSEK